MRFSKLKMPQTKIPETITEEEFIKLLGIVKQKNHKLAFMLGFYACMRVSEVTKLKPENIDKGQKIIRIKAAKGNKDRNIPLPKELMGGISYLPVGVGDRALQIAFKNYGREALNKNLHFHTLRHSGATHYLNKKKWSTRQVQVLLGHSKIQTTEIYTHVSPQDLIELMWEK